MSDASFKARFERDVLLDAIHNAGLCVIAKKEHRPPLRAVRFEYEAAERELRLIACDSRILLRQRLAVVGSDGGGGDLDISIAWDSLQRALKLFTEPGYVNLEVAEGRLTLSDLSASFTPDVESGAFPTYGGLFNTNDNPSGSMALYPKVLAMFAKMRGLGESPVAFTQCDEFKAAFFSVGATVDGLVMPQRVSS